MATISSPGIGSGLDVKSIVSQLVALEQKPLDTLKTKAAGLQAQLSSFGKLTSQISDLQLQAQTLASPLTWGAMTVSSNNSAAVSGVAGTAASAGSINVQVNQLASGQSTASSVIASGTDLSGTLTIQLGQWTAPGGVTTFTQRSGTSSVDVTINSGDSLDQVASKINAAQTGVTASVMTDTQGSRLVLRSSDTGDTAGFRITAGNLGTSSSLQQLAYAPDTTPTDSSRKTATAQNASAVVNGVTLTSANNQFNGAVPGVNFTVSQVTTSPATLTVASDSASMRSALESFVMAYNALASNLANQTKYDAATKTAGLLQGDSTAVGVQNTLRRLVAGFGASNATFKRLSDVGVEFQLDGTLKLNDSKLTTALSDPADLKVFFTANPSGSNQTKGLGRQLSDFTQGMLNATSGTLIAKNKNLQSALDRNSTEQNRVSDRISQVQARLQAQYSSLDSKMASLTALSNYVSQQVTSWNNQKSN